MTLITPSVFPVLSDDASPRDRRRHEVLSEAIARQRPSLAARMWAYRGVHLPINVFDFTVSRDRCGPDDVLSEFRGFLMADCWSGFKQIHLRSDLRITRVACMTHARRKVLESLGNSTFDAARISRFEVTRVAVPSCWRSFHGLGAGFFACGVLILLNCRHTLCCTAERWRRECAGEAGRSRRPRQWRVSGAGSTRFQQTEMVRPAVGAATTVRWSVR